MPSLLQRQIFKEIANLFVLAVGVLLTLILISRAVQMRELFLGLESLDGLGKQQKAEERPKPVARRLRLRPWLTAVAATLLTLIVVSAALYVNHQQNYCEAIVYGQKVTDKTAIRAEMAQTMKAVAIEGDNGVDDQLHDVLMTENNE